MSPGGTVGRPGSEERGGEAQSGSEKGTLFCAVPPNPTVRATETEKGEDGESEPQGREREKERRQRKTNEGDSGTQSIRGGDVEKEATRHAETHGTETEIVKTEERRQGAGETGAGKKDGPLGH